MAGRIGQLNAVGKEERYEQPASRQEGAQSTLVPGRSQHEHVSYRGTVQTQVSSS